MSNYSVDFRIAGHDCCPSRISLELAVEPWRMESYVNGTDGKESRFLWCFDGILSNEERGKGWDSIEDGLIHVMDLLLPRHDTIKGYISQYDVYWWCGHFQTSVNSSTAFSVKLLQQLSEFGVPVILDSYYSPDIPGETTNNP